MWWRRWREDFGRVWLVFLDTFVLRLWTLSYLIAINLGLHFHHTDVQEPSEIPLMSSLFCINTERYKVDVGIVTPVCMTLIEYLNEYHILLRIQS